MISKGIQIVYDITGAANVAASDNSADEIFRSISSNGGYKFMNTEVDCSKVLFLITTNETREELEQNFGINGISGGGIQRLNVIEFGYLTLDACRGIVDDLIEEVSKVLIKENGLFNLKNVTFDKKSLEAMANYIFEDKIMQGRAKNKLEDKIYSLFSETIGEESGKSFKISFTNGKDIQFEKTLAQA